MPRATVQRRAPATRRALLLGAIALLIVLIVALAALTKAGPFAAAPAPAATPTVDPRLILRARTEPISASLSGGLKLAGTLYPAIPGPNTLRLAVTGSGRLPVQGNLLALSASMPGMVMRPVVTTLRAGAHGYSPSRVTFPMFGLYRAHVVVETPAGPATGVVTITLALPGS